MENTPNTFFSLSANLLDGSPCPMSRYRGKVLLVVNTASQCGYTPQYAGLEQLAREYADKDLVVLGFPSNEFGGQEPGTAEQIAEFCSVRYRLTFPLFEKVCTKGPEQSSVYRFLASAQGEPRWNFHKYLINRSGQVVAAFPSKVPPEDSALRAAIDSALQG